MRVLSIGGTGNISTAVTTLLVERGVELSVFNRGRRATALAEGVRQIHGDIRDPAGVAEALRGEEFDVVVDWLAYMPEHVETDIALFAGRTAQYVYISSASAYLKPSPQFPITETAPLGNPHWQYARDKIACELRLRREHEERGFPVTIVRPSYTYGETWIPAIIAGWDYTLVDRMLHGRKVIVPGDGHSLWTMTYNTDFARGLAGLLGHRDAVGEAFHITSDEVLTWDQIFETIAAAAGVEADIVHIASDFINAVDPEIGANMLGDKAHTAVFDNAKIKRFVPGFEAVVPFAEGVRRSIAWFDADPSRKVVDAERNARIDGILEAYLSGWPGGGREARAAHA
jgi:nucleoside-diphosphate-sugar epimerase